MQFFSITQGPPEIIYFKKTPAFPAWRLNGGPLRCPSMSAAQMTQYWTQDSEQTRSDSKI